MSRSLCDQCQYPIQTCVCNWIEAYPNQTKIIVLQHPKEVAHAKNTVGLIKLCTDNIDIIIGENEGDFGSIAKQVEKAPNDYALLYPSQRAQVLSQHNQSNSQSTETFSNIIVIDGTWRKAKKMYLSNAWLDSIKHVTLPPRNDSDYRVRKTSVEGGLSTIEAVAYALQAKDNSDPAPLLSALEGLRSRFIQHMPDEVKLRYKKNGD